MWDFIKKKSKGDSEGRQLRFLLRSTYGAPAVGFVPVSGGDYPASNQSSVVEGITEYKDFALTVEVERTLIAKAISDVSRYGEPLAEELRAKTIAMSRLLSASLYQDGSGVIGTVSAVTDGGTDAVITLSTANAARGFVGWFEQGDRVVISSTAGAPRVSDTAVTPDYWEVSSLDRDNNRVTLQPKDSSDVDLTFSGANTDVAAADIIYREGIFDDANTVHPASISVGTTELNTLSSMWNGLDALTKSDGSLVNGITLSGNLGGTRRDAGGQPIDSQDFQKLMSQIKIGVGQGRYKYSMAFMAWEALDALIESRETDRRFQSIKDNKRGVHELGYVHARDTLIFEADEWCPKNRIYVCPDKSDVLQFHGSDMEFVRPDGGQRFFLSNASSGQGHARQVRAYMEGQGALMTIHSAATGVIENFSV